MLKISEGEEKTTSPADLSFDFDRLKEGAKDLFRASERFSE